MTMAKLAPPKKASKPTAPKKPTSRSKTGNAACSSAASNWQLALRGKAALDPETYRTLAKCRSMNRTAKMAEAQGRTGKLSAMGESAVKARLQARFDSGLITAKSRSERLDMLLKQRAERGKTEAAKPQAAQSNEPMRYKEFIASGRTDAEWDAYAAEQNNKFRLKKAKEVRDKWRSGENVSGQTVLGWLDNKNVRVSDDMRSFLQHDKTLVSTSGVEGVNAGKHAKKVQNLVGTYIGRGSVERRQRAEFLLKKRKERGNLAPTPAPVQPGSGEAIPPKARNPLAMSAEEQKIRERYREIAKTSPQKPVKTAKPETVRRPQSDELVTVYQSNEQFRGTPLPYTFAPPAMPKSSGEAIPPNAAKYSLGGKLAPGRGTDERKEIAYQLQRIRKPVTLYVQAEKAFAPAEYVDKYGGGSGIMVPKPFDHNAAREKVARQMGLYDSLNKNRKKAKTLTRKANKLAR